MTTRDFHLGDVLSVTTERLVSPRHVGGLYDILGYMTGESLFTHQLPRAGRACAPALLAQHPTLADVDASGVTADNWSEWLAEQVARFGETLPVAPLAAGEYAPRDPLVELSEMIGGDR